jgi:transposase InsO family protein
VKTVTDTLDVARSNVAERIKGARPKRGPQTRDGDLELAADIRRLADARPTYGYRRIAALLRRERRCGGGAPVNAKRVYRLMQKHGLLLTPCTGRRRPRARDGRVATLRSNIRWCSDALEFTCWNGEVVRIAFALDCHDREVIAWLAITEGISGEMIRDLMVECVEARFAARPCSSSCAMALRQRLDLRRGQDHRNRHRAEPAAVLHPGGKPRKQRHRRGLREDLQARLRQSHPHPGCPDCPRRRRPLDAGL